MSGHALNPAMLSFLSGFERRPSQIAFGHQTKHVFERCHWVDLFTIHKASDIDIRWNRPLKEYCENFIKPIKDTASHLHCVFCDARIGIPPPAGTGLDKANIDFTDIPGEARCAKCAYPLRYHHHIWEGEPRRSNLLVSLEFFPLQYHPDSPILDSAPKK